MAELRVNLIGEKFGKLLVKKESGRNKKGSVLWECLCDCGNITTVSTGALRSSNTTSCGCFRKENASNIFRKHYLKGTTEYCSWQLMKDRCYNENNKTFKYYGGKGIKVCDEWLNSPKQFVSDMGLKPNREYTIDRINCNGNYEPSNCKWASKSEQSRNRSDSIRFTINNVEKSLHDWADIYNIEARVVYKRIWRGWDIMKALTTKKRVVCNG
jgi:hypothetical protein